MKFELVTGFKENALAQLSYPELPYHTTALITQTTLYYNMSTPFLCRLKSIKALVKQIPPQ